MSQIFNPQKYVKLIVSLLSVGASTLIALGVTGGHVTLAQALNIAIALVGAFHVWYVTETTDNPSGKAVIAGVTAALMTAASFITGGGHVDLAEWMQIITAGLAATGILAIPTKAK